MEQLIIFFSSPVGKIIALVFFAVIAWKVLKSVIKAAIVIAIIVGGIYLLNGINKPHEVAYLEQVGREATNDVLFESVIHEF